MRNRFVLFVSAILLAACGGTGGTASGSPSSSSLSGYINVFAAASLTASFNALGISFHQAHPGVGVNFNFAGTPTLVTQIEQGAPADVFASADTANMTKLTTDGFTSGASQIFARNQLEIVVAPGNPKGITGLADLAKPGLIYISEGPTVPAGTYSLQALATAGVKVTPKSLETSVTAVISKIELGEADAGIVYTTDIQAAGNKVQGVQIPAADNVIATYPIVSVKGTKYPDVATAFIDYVVSATGQSTLATFGFLSAA
ncbi:MAG TPA: molybdate ABC transporter substrate-binding protein [Candidatus Acidoferrum sp.]|jgi:molybdate transport system substrate-binding protein|nr:molybdate ABC transporter substrate-binding protein [Candidatus Angelobacter sp.]HXD82007.1 molybdate ABC transporter substrate-binding protein [Candidatus Acidoferrum sp.]